MKSSFRSRTDIIRNLEDNLTSRVVVVAEHRTEIPDREVERRFQGLRNRPAIARLELLATDSQRWPFTRQATYTAHLFSNEA